VLACSYDDNFAQIDNGLTKKKGLFQVVLALAEAEHISPIHYHLGMVMRYVILMSSMAPFISGQP
jgi:hypothetical protein